MDDTAHPKIVEIACCDDFEAASPIVTHVALSAGERASNAGVERGAVENQPFFVSYVEKRAVVDSAVWLSQFDLTVSSGG